MQRQRMRENGLSRGLALPRLLGHHEAHDLRVQFRGRRAEALVQAQLVALQRHDDAAIAREHQRLHVGQAQSAQAAEQGVSGLRRRFGVLGVLLVAFVALVGIGTDRGVSVASGAAGAATASSKKPSCSLTAGRPGRCVA